MELYEDLSPSGSLILRSPGLTRLSRLLLVLLFKPVHKQAIPGGAQHSKELSDGKGICVAADCRGQRGGLVDNFQAFLTGEGFPTLPLSGLTLLPKCWLRPPTGAHSPADLSTPRPQVPSPQWDVQMGCLPAPPHTQRPVPTGQVGEQRVEGADEEVVPQLYHRKPHQVPGKEPRENIAPERTLFLWLCWSWGLCWGKEGLGVNYKASRGVG